MDPLGQLTIWHARLNATTPASRFKVYQLGFLGLKKGLGVLGSRVWGLRIWGLRIWGLRVLRFSGLGFWGVSDLEF